MGGHIIAAFTSANVGFDTYFGFFSRFLQLQEVPENNTKELTTKRNTPQKWGASFECSGFGFSKTTLSLESSDFLRQA